MTDFPLLDTAPLRDQRTMCYVEKVGSEHRTVENVERAWQQWAVDHGFPIRSRHRDYTTDLHTSRKTIVVYVSGGKWIGDCPNCRDGVAGWPLHPRGACLGCGTIYHLAYPSERECLELAELLTARPEQERNYFPHLGETIEFVRRENAAYKYATPETGMVSLATLEEQLGPDEFAALRAKVGI